MLNLLAIHQSFNHHTSPMHCAPYYKSICSSMPETAHGEYNHRVEHPACFAASVASEREVDIVAKPCGERDMPSAPEVGYGLCKIRSNEVSWQFNAKESSATYCHQGVASKVCINLNGVEHTGQEQCGAVMLRDIGIYRIHIYP